MLKETTVAWNKTVGRGGVVGDGVFQLDTNIMDSLHACRWVPTLKLRGDHVSCM